MLLGTKTSCSYQRTCQRYVEVATTDEMVFSARGRAGTWSVLRILLGIDDLLLLAVFRHMATLARGAS